MDNIDYIMGLSKSELRTQLIAQTELIKAVAIISDRIANTTQDEDIDADIYQLWQLLRRYHPTVI